MLRTVAYDPWGQAREGNNWLAPLAPDALEDLGLGFTGHPARLDADLVDMGGRSYHPRLGRFFSPDPLVVSPLDAQAYNRYSYVHNRPLVATDPTGYETQGLGSDGGSGATEDLLYHCEDERGCQRDVVVAAPDGTSSLDQWNRTLAWFENQNGPGQGGPGGGGNPYSPNGVRHGTDAGQPGGSTDILQGGDHGAGLSHTHDPKLHHTPDGRTFMRGHEQPGRPVSFDDVQNIRSGAATPSKPKGR